MTELEEDILRQLMVRPADDLFTPPAAATVAIRRQRRRRMRAARQTLLKLSAAAAAAARPSGRYVVQTENTDTTDVYPAGPVISGPNGTLPAVLNNGPGSEPTNAQLDAMPPSAEALCAALLAEAKQQMQLSFMKPPPPTDDDMVFEQAAVVLWDPNLSPDLRAAL